MKEINSHHKKQEQEYENKKQAHNQKTWSFIVGIKFIWNTTCNKIDL